MQPDTGVTIRLWDAPVRTVHWAFVLLMPALWWSAKEGNLALHRSLGYIMLALILFRIFWGFFGSSTARFVSFVKGPRAVLRYVRTLFGTTPVTTLGHNPLGAVSVIALLGLLATQAGIGLFAQDVDGIESGPLSYLVSFNGADAAREWHHSLFDVLLVVIVIHIAAILFYLFIKRDNLVRPMVTGKKQYTSPVPEMGTVPLWRAAVIALFSAGFTYWVSKGAPLF
jgi:cytochrome b